MRVSVGREGGREGGREEEEEEEEGGREFTEFIIILTTLSLNMYSHSPVCVIAYPLRVYSACPFNYLIN